MNTFGQWIRMYTKLDMTANVWESRRSHRMLVSFNKGYSDRSFDSYGAMADWMSKEGFSIKETPIRTL